MSGHQPGLYSLSTNGKRERIPAAGKTPVEMRTMRTV